MEKFYAYLLKKGEKMREKLGSLGLEKLKSEKQKAMGERALHHPNEIKHIIVSNTHIKSF